MAAGAEFACGACGAGLTVPGGAAPAAPRAAASASPGAVRRHRPEAAAPARRRGEPRERPARAASRTPLLVGVGAAVVVVGAGIAWVAMRGGKEGTAPEPRTALGPAGPSAAGGGAVPPGEAAARKAQAPPRPVDPEEAAWAAATTEEARTGFLEERLPLSGRSDEVSKRLFGLLAAKSRADLARKVAEARLAADPESPWANETLDRKDFGGELGSLAANKDLADNPIPEWERLKRRVEEKRTRVGPGAERREVEADIAAARREAERLSDPWTRRSLEAAKAVRDHPAFQRFLPVDTLALPPYLVLAQRQQDDKRHSTKNVLENHSKFFRCLTGEFLRIMKEAGLPTPTVAEMGNPVLLAFLFTDRNAFDRWHWDQGAGKDSLKGVRAYYAWGSTNVMMMYDTGAPTQTQDDDTCTAFHEATHQLVHYYRRYYMTLEDRKADPSAPEVGLSDRRLADDSLWFQEGFAEFFGAADRISSRSGEWRLFRPHRARMAEWGDPSVRRTPQWTLEEVLELTDYPHLYALAEKKWPGHKDELFGLFYAQAWALHHFLYFGKDGRYRERYLRWVHEEMCGRTGSEVFLKCMEAGSTKEAREDFLDTLTRGWLDHQKELLTK